jgi:biotin transporter BioY
MTSHKIIKGILILAIIVIAQGTIMFVFGNVPFSARVIDVFLIATLLGFIVGFIIGIKEVRR